MKKLILLSLLILSISAFSQKVTNTWDGSWNAYWHNANNWSLNHIPLSTEDVVIPGGLTRYPSTSTYEEEINSLTIQSGAYVRIGASTLTVNNDVYVYGEIRMYDTDALMWCDDITWYSGSEAQTTGSCEFVVLGNWEFSAGANVQLDNGKVGFYGNTNQYIRSKDVDCYFNNVYVQKSAGVFGLSSQSTATCTIKGYLTFGGINYSFTSPSSQKIVIGYGIQNGDSSVDIALDNGTIEFSGNSTNCYFFPNTGDYVNNLIVNTGSFDMDMNTFYTTSFEIKNDLTINSGSLDVNSMDLIVGGDWDNNVGSSGFYERTRKVTFNGTTQQYCSDETFYTLELNKSAGALRTSGTDVVCQEYDWISGAVDVLSGSFTANDLLDNAIQGKFYLNSGGTINLTNDGGYIDLKGDLYIYGGNFNVYGGSVASYWPYGEDASITMSDGVLDIKDQGIQINNNAYALIDNITGGRIKCTGYLYGDRADFVPTAGVFEMYGPSNANIRTTNGCRFWDLAINKEADKDAHEVKPFTDRDGTYYGGSKSSAAVAAGNIQTYNALYIDGGTLDMASYDFSTNSSVAIYGNLKMNNANNDFNVSYDIFWAPGSTDDITAGNFNVGRHWYFQDGTNAQLGTGNTVHFTGAQTQRIYNNDADAEFAAIQQQKSGMLN
nr:hypothetical protein [Bacteroidota bacterium]